MFYVFLFDSFHYALILCVLLFAYTVYLMLYTATHTFHVTVYQLESLLTNVGYYCGATNKIWQSTVHF